MWDKVVVVIFFSGFRIDLYNELFIVISSSARSYSSSCRSRGSISTVFTGSAGRGSNVRAGGASALPQPAPLSLLGPQQSSGPAAGRLEFESSWNLVGT